MYNVNNSIKICRFLKFYGSFDCSSWSYDHLHISCSPENHTLLFGLYASFYGKFPWILWIFFGDFLKSGLRFRFPSRSEKLQFVCQMCSALKPPLCKGRWPEGPEGLCSSMLRISHEPMRIRNIFKQSPSQKSDRFLTAPFAQGGLWVQRELPDKLKFDK